MNDNPANEPEKEKEEKMSKADEEAASAMAMMLTFENSVAEMSLGIE